MEWQPVGTIATTSNYVFTLAITGTLFKLKHITESSKRSSLKIAIRQAFEDNGTIALFDYKLINCKVEQDILLFSLPKGLNNRRLAFKRVDNYLSEDWLIEIESLDFIESGVDMPVTISDIADLYQRLDSIQVELTLKALDLDLDNHVGSTNNPHNVSAIQVGADIAGSAVTRVFEHEGTINHPLVTTSSQGMMAASDKLKINGIAPNATTNETNPFLLNRNNHQGTQPISTVEGLIAAFSGFVNLTASQVISGVKSFNNLVYLSQHLISNSYVSAKEYYLANTPLSLEIARTTANANGYCTDIGFFQIPNGGVVFRLSLAVSDTSFSLAKYYTVVTSYVGSDTGWLRLVPLKSSVFAPYNDCEIDIKIHLDKTSLRIRRSGDGDNGTAVIRLEFTGARTTYFEQAYGTGFDNNVVGTY
jgi:hypothetical protein